MAQLIGKHQLKHLHLQQLSWQEGYFCNTSGGAFTVNLTIGFCWKYNCYKRLFQVLFKQII